MLIRVWAGISLVILIIIGTIFVSGGIAQLTADFRGETGKKEKIKADGDYRIAAYDEFFDLCSSVQAKNDNIRNIEDQLKVTDDEDQRQVLQSGLLSQKNTKADLVREYNSKATSEGTRGQFKDSELPYQIDVNDEDVECGS